jgi:16S rRNA (uracil1498-N3)-methyltransferase
MSRFYAPIECFDGASVTLSPDESHHLRDVLRVHVGDEIGVFDGTGREFACRVVELDKKAARLSIINETEPPSPESSCEVTVGAAILKADKFETVVQKSVELGVVRLVPLITHRAEVRPEILDKKLVRWRRIALDASKQCGRARLMDVAPAVSISAFVQASNDLSARLVFSERGGSPFSTLRSSDSITAVFGPEGGWEDSELDQCRSNGFSVITLGRRILRADTAAIAITAILQHQFGDLN